MSPEYFGVLSWEHSRNPQHESFGFAQTYAETSEQTTKMGLVGLVGYEKTIENIKMGIQETTICVKQKLFSS